MTDDQIKAEAAEFARQNKRRIVEKYASIDKYPSEAFVDQYFRARENANTLKKIGSQVRLDLLLENIDGANKRLKAGVDQIDDQIPELFSKYDIETIIR